MNLTPLFIKIEVLKELSVINGNVDTELLEPTLVVVQDTYIKSILGRKFYKAICEQINNDNVSTENATLINDYILNVLINKVVSELYVDLQYKLRNKAIMTGTSEQAQPVDNDGLSQISRKYSNIAESYKAELLEFLCENSTDYPLFCTTENTANFQSNIFTGNVREKTRKYR